MEQSHVMEALWVIISMNVSHRRDDNEARPPPPNNMDNTISLNVKGTMTHFTYLISYYLFTDYSVEWAPPYYPMMGIFLLSVFY